MPEEEFGTFQPGENARDVVHPAAYEHVLAVNASMAGTGGADPHQYVLESSATDLAAPTADGVSYTINGGTCLLGEPATSWAAAEVSGVLALGFAHFPDDTPAMAVTRLLLTADGRPDIPNRLSGAGDVQPVRRPHPPARHGRGRRGRADRPRPDTQVYAAPEPEPDVLAATRRNAVWWGLLGGGALCWRSCCGRCWPASGRASLAEVLGRYSKPGPIGASARALVETASAHVRGRDERHPTQHQPHDLLHDDLPECVSS